MIEAKSKLSKEDDGISELECMMNLLSKFDISDIRLDSSRWPRGALFLQQNGWLEDGKQSWAKHNWTDRDSLAKTMLEVLRDGGSAELRIVTSEGSIIVAEINDNDEYWFLYGSVDVLNAEWFEECKKSLPEWKFKQQSKKC